MHTVASARHRPSSAPHARTPAPFGSRLYGGVLALVAVAALAGWFMLYPLDRVMAGALLAGYGLLVVLRPASWLIIVPAVWPVVDLAPWSGHFHVTESDALILATLAALGLREAFAPPPATLSGRAPVKLTVAALALFGLLAASVVISGLRGLYPLPPLDAAALVSYSSGLNALRVGKGFVLAFALIPFLHLAIRRDGDAALERLTRGMMLGLGTCALAALWERLAFPGLTDFANDYRTTALFWEMHVGGAALDAWLMLCFPFAVLALSQARSAPGKALALLVLGIGSYALFTTFSRIVYAALVISLSLLGALALARPASTATPRRPGVLVALIAIALLGCGLSFPEGGYRALLAFVGTLLLAYLGGGAVAGMRIRQLLAGVVAGTLLLAISVPVALWLPKGVYLVYALSWAITAGLLGVRAHRHDTAPGLAVVALLTWTTLNVVGISAFWSEPTRFTGTALAALLVLAVLAVQALCQKTALVAQSPRHLRRPGRAGPGRHADHHPRQLLHERPRRGHRRRYRRAAQALRQQPQPDAHQRRHPCRNRVGPLPGRLFLGDRRSRRARFPVAAPGQPGPLHAPGIGPGHTPRRRSADAVPAHSPRYGQPGPLPLPGPQRNRGGAAIQPVPQTPALPRRLHLQQR
ncbi:MAG: hypothetical protein IPQ01_15750, partial [Zoogloea sp.]|nr:hypothetical protein [Zoogloea sp.]